MSDPLRRMLSLHDFEAAARRILPKPLYAYVSGAVEDGQSERGNRRAYDDYGFRPKVLVDVSRRSTRCTVLGREYAAPVGVAPMGIAALTSYRGDVMLARAAAEAGVPCIMSGSSLIRLETVMEAAPGTWFQAYLPGDGAQIAALIDRVAAAGVDTLVLTVDTPVAANRENNVRAGFSTPLRPSVGLAWQGVTHPRWLIGTFLRTLARHGMPHFENNYATRGAPILSGNVLRDFSDRGHLNWQHVAAIRKTWKGRMVLKGILHPDDARAARARHGRGHRVQPWRPAARWQRFSLACLARHRGRRGRHGRHARQRRAARHGRAESDGAWRALRIRGPSVQLRGDGGRPARRGPCHRADRRRDPAQHGPARYRRPARGEPEPVATRPVVASRQNRFSNIRLTSVRSRAYMGKLLAILR